MVLQGCNVLRCLLKLAWDLGALQCKECFAMMWSTFLQSPKVDGMAYGLNAAFPVFYSPGSLMC